MPGILVSTDFSDAAFPAIDMAFHIAKRSSAEITFLHVSSFEESHFQPGQEYSDAMREATQRASDQLDAYLRKVRSDLSDGVSYVSQIRFGNSAWEEIISAADDLKSELILMGTHGESGLKRFLTGSTTDKVISHAKIPVLAVPEQSFSAPEQLIWATTLEKADKELQDLQAINNFLKLELKVLYIDYGWARTKNEEDQLKKLRESGIPLTVVSSVLNDSVNRNLALYMEGKSSALLCMFHERKKGIIGLLAGSAAKSVSHELTFPLLIMPAR